MGGYKLYVVCSIQVLKMEPEREIVNWWLNRSGFFTVNNIKAIQNKEIGTLALKFGKDGSNIQHIEVNCSVSNPINLTMDKSGIEKSVDGYINKKFESEIVVKKIKESIKELTGQERGYQKAIVLGNIAQANRNKIIRLLIKKGYHVYKFEDILCEVMKNLDKQNYQSATIRNLQLVKYILLSEPKALAKLLERKNKYDVLNQNTREEFLKEFLSQEENKRIMQKELNESILVSLLKNSSLKKPERLARIVSEDVLGGRSGKRFMRVLEEKGFKKKEKVRKKKEKPLSYFLKEKK